MNPDKKVIIDALFEKVISSPYVLVVDYTGMTVPQFSVLRNRRGGFGRCVSSNRLGGGFGSRFGSFVGFRVRVWIEFLLDDAGDPGGRLEDRREELRKDGFAGRDVGDALKRRGVDCRVGCQSACGVFPAW